MPKVSDKKKLFSMWKKVLYGDLLFLEIFESSDSNDKQNEVFEELCFVKFLEERMRYGKPFVHNSIPKTRSFLCKVLPDLDEERFKEFVRVGWFNFKILLDLIKEDPVFNGPRSCNQLPVEVQLIITLYRLGCSGEGATVSKIASRFGISDGGSLQNITERVFRAILNLKDKYLYWPSASQRKMLVSETAHELPYCIGYVDGTEIKLAEKPFEDPEAYFSRKHMYSVKAQVVCDHKLRILHIEVGHPGSVHDARIYKESDLFLNPQTFFSGHEWLAGDSAYKVTSTVLTPFRTNSSEFSLEERLQYNKIFSRYRVRIEHCKGRLKERFNSLKELKIQIRNTNSVKKIARWVIVCAIIHNIIIDNNDTDDFDFNDDCCIMEDEAGEENSDNVTVAGDEKRSEILKLLQNINN